MLYLFWLMLNIGLFSAAVYICYKATKLIRLEMGLWPALFFVFVILTLYGKGNNSDETVSNFNQSKFENFALEENLGKSLLQIRCYRPGRNYIFKISTNDTIWNRQRTEKQSPCKRMELCFGL